MRCKLPASIVVLVVIAAMAAIAGAGAQAASGTRCAAFSVRGHRVDRVVAQLASCAMVRRMIGIWAGRGFPQSGPNDLGLWSCSIVAGKGGGPQCSAGLNGIVTFRIRPRP